MPKAALTVAATTALLLVIGRPKLGEAVIALLYVVPVGWAASRWGQGPGLAAAVTAALCFDFFFIPPFFTFTVGSLGRLFQNFTSQAGQALERTRLAEADQRLNALATQARVNSSRAPHTRR